jgi:hypothetical protein
MMKRDTWTFGYTASQTLKGTLEKIKYHSARLEWWEKTMAEVMENIKASGLVIDMSLANVISNSYGRDPTVKVDNVMMADLRECVQKIQEHRGRVTEYEGWEQVLESQGEAQLQLTHEDWLYFFGQSLAPTADADKLELTKAKKQVDANVAGIAA